MDDVWGDDYDNEEESDFLNVESKTDFVKNNLSIILEEIDKKINDFAKENPGEGPLADLEETLRGRYDEPAHKAVP